MIFKYLDKTPEFAVPFNGWIADSAQVIGDVYLGHQANVWFGAVIRGDNDRIHIGDYSNVQENSVIHTDAGIKVTIGDYVTIGHLAMLHGCEIGDNSLIGIGAVVLNNVKIGKNCLIGAKALITEGQVIPDNSLVMGAPAKVVKTLTDEQVAMLKMSALHYSERCQKFKTGLTEIAMPD
ncbi:gamma carbonic anhydrase family protein [Psychrobacter pocilloporae]|jgi:carbonic anhydrase/acetyltransferase-like protein (isoleucine patch superfamily)|uniref:Gamma carbonic anhydrase family protein n=1 Tax=Psychrobacter pocilloporae TaxID=1775882 RepID=A0ABT6IVS3_9GAMM|nr:MULTISPECIES: gamma carbonic anhydrase family protein [Psychrobacter]MDE0844833.1 gamma carbonic anhydrase family protein [Psychrobacter pacificensis]MDH4905177.1 gamma carbonic anhydrase family protein [Psychrobacter pocilloporae]MED6316325.1 gamma carbonic anhydrase family protein [Pseudomonadota bacterium]|tara:strand:- start:46 stop:582 length:537 start_codon:yes stop_codon:yes gene_type:complete